MTNFNCIQGRSSACACFSEPVPLILYMEIKRYIKQVYEENVSSISSQSQKVQVFKQVNLQDYKKTFNTGKFITYFDINSDI